MAISLEELTAAALEGSVGPLTLAVGAGALAVALAAGSTRPLRRIASTSVLAVGIHTMAMFAVAGAIAMVVYRKVGVDVLRRAWINVDLIWIGALVVTGGITVGIALM